MITIKDLLYSTRISAQYSVMTYMGIGSRKSGYIYMYNWFILLDTWNLHSIVNQLYSDKNFLKRKEKKLAQAKDLKHRVNQFQSNHLKRAF